MNITREDVERHLAIETAIRDNGYSWSNSHDRRKGLAALRDNLPVLSDEERLIRHLEDVITAERTIMATARHHKLLDSGNVDRADTTVRECGRRIACLERAIASLREMGPTVQPVATINGRALCLDETTISMIPTGSVSTPSPSRSMELTPSMSTTATPPETGSASGSDVLSYETGSLGYLAATVHSTPGVPAAATPSASADPEPHPSWGLLCDEFGHSWADWEPHHDFEVRHCTACGEGDLRDVPAAAPEPQPDRESVGAAIRRIRRRLFGTD